MTRATRRIDEATLAAIAKDGRASAVAKLNALAVGRLYRAGKITYNSGAYRVAPVAHRT